MPRRPGERLGPYEIVAPLGAGGIGEVYQARDTRLDRTVAVKVLPSRFADSDERRQRFQREARAVSRLNHPHVCTLYDVGEEGGVDFLVMEYLEGESLHDRLRRGALPLAAALRCGVEIASALDHAHRQGLVHRDLKPGNVMLTAAGAKLLDFGLARQAATGETDANASALPTDEAPLTGEGMLLGTVPYMAPEQLEGHPVDARTDIFAFGALLHEMVTGERAFRGESRASLIAAILEHEPPPLSAVAPVAPPALDHVARTCLAKDPEHRWQSAADVARQLAWIAEGGAVAVAPPTTASPRRAALHVALGAVVALGIAALLRRDATPTPERPVTRWSVPPETSYDGAGPVSFGRGIALSPSGDALAYVGIRDGVRFLYLRPLASLEARRLDGTDGASEPFFSPDGRGIAFFADGQLKKIPVAGGRPTVLCDAPAYTRGGAWSADGVIYFAHSSYAGLSQVSENGGEPAPATDLDPTTGELEHGYPDVLPDGSAPLFHVTRAQGRSLVVRSLRTGRQTLLEEDGSHPRYAASGHLLFMRGNALQATPFDAGRLEVQDPASSVIDNVRGGGQVVIAGDGTLAYIPDRTSTGRGSLVWVDRRGIQEPIDGVEREYTSYGPRLSPDGRRLAVVIRSEGEVVDFDVWVLELARGALTRFTFGQSLGAIWSPDGGQIFFHSNRRHVSFYNTFSRSADGTGNVRPLTDEPGLPTSITSDGRTLLFRTIGAGWDIGALSLDGDGTREMLLQGPFDEHSGTLSPDDRWLAYVSNESGRDEVYVRAFPGMDGKRQISTDGGAEPVWARDGTELFYRDGDAMMAVAVQPLENLEASRPQKLFEAPFVLGQGPTSGPKYDVTANGQRFVAIRPSATATDPPRVHVVLNWRS